MSYQTVTEIARHKSTSIIEATFSSIPNSKQDVPVCGSPFLKGKPRRRGTIVHEALAESLEGRWVDRSVWPYCKAAKGWLHDQEVSGVLCVIHSGDNATLLAQIKDTLSGNGLLLNTEKTFILTRPFIGYFEFLGYSFKPADNTVRIARKKIKKLKNRVVLVLRAFVADPLPTAFADLRDRLRFLTSSAQLPSPDRGAPIFTGIRHVYRACTEKELIEQLRDMDGFLHSLLSSARYPLSLQIRAKLAPTERKKLKKLSFVSAFEQKIRVRLTAKRIRHIIKAWHYE